MARIWERCREWLKCSLHGHRGLSRAPAYAEVLAGATDKELHYCGACGGPAWVSVPHEARGKRTWAGSGLGNP